MPFFACGVRGEALSRRKSVRSGAIDDLDGAAARKPVYLWKREEGKGIEKAEAFVGIVQRKAGQLDNAPDAIDE